MDCNIVSRYLVPLAMLLAFIAFMPRGAHAQTPTTGVQYCTQDNNNPPTTACGSSAAAAASALAAAAGQRFGVSISVCNVTETSFVEFVAGQQTCETGPVLAISQSNGLICPGGSVLSGSTCSCPSGSSWNGSTCSTPQAALAECQAAAGGPVTVPGDAGSASTICHNGCTAHVEAVTCTSGTTQCTTMGSFSKVAATCSGTLTNTTGAATCASGQCPANVNGQQLCLACGSPGTTPTARTSSSSSSSDGTSTRSDVSRSCNGTVCRTTTTNTKLDASGNPISSTTSEEVTNDPDKRPETECDDATRSLGLLKCAQLGTPSPGGAVAATSVGPSSISPASGLAAPGACPADIPLPMGMSFSFSGICQGGTALRPLIIALAWLAAGYIVFGGLKRG